MYCINCGYQLIENAKYCANCGAKNLAIIQTSVTDFNVKKENNQINNLLNSLMSIKNSRLFFSNDIPKNRFAEFIEKTNYHLTVEDLVIYFDSTHLYENPYGWIITQDKIYNASFIIDKPIRIDTITNIELGFPYNTLVISANDEIIEIDFATTNNLRYPILQLLLSLIPQTLIINIDEKNCYYDLNANLELYDPNIFEYKNDYYKFPKIKISTDIGSPNWGRDNMLEGKFITFSEDDEDLEDIPCKIFIHKAGVSINTNFFLNADNVHFDQIINAKVISNLAYLRLMCIGFGIDYEPGPLIISNQLDENQSKIFELKYWCFRTSAMNAWFIASTQNNIQNFIKNLNLSIDRFYNT